jgi:GTP cyclohydrolase I
MPTEHDAEEEDVRASLALHPRSISEEQMRRYEGWIAEIFTAFGLDLHTPGTEATPHRFLLALFHSTAGYEGDPKLLRTFPRECKGGPDCEVSQLVEGPIPYYALCEHHALPFHGRAYIGYIAHERILGLSKFTRLVRIFSERFTVQERLGQQIADTVDVVLKPHGVAVYLDGEHLCSQMRGIRETSSFTRTTFWRGHYAENASLRTEFLEHVAARR